MDRLKMNTFEFLKNYKDFANHIRYNTSEILLNELQKTNNLELQKTLMLKIIEELVCSTEDLAMWLTVLHNRNDGNPIFRDVWERLLSTEISQNDTLKILLGFKRIRTTNGFIKKMDFPSIKDISNKLAANESLVVDAVAKILETIKKVIDTRRDSKGIVVRTHNKIKHGMMVYSTIGTDVSWIRDFSGKVSKKNKKIFRRNRSIEIPIDLDKANRMVGTIKANSYGIEALINLLLIDFEYRFSTGKIRITKKNKEKYLVEITKALS